MSFHYVMRSDNGKKMLKHIVKEKTNAFQVKMCDLCYVQVHISLPLSLKTQNDQNLSAAYLSVTQHLSREIALGATADGVAVHQIHRYANPSNAKLDAHAGHYVSDDLQ